MTTEKTAAEQHFDALVEKRRSEGRQKYKRGLTHTDGYDWNRMALEEAMDLSQYLAAENLRLNEFLGRILQSAHGKDRDSAIDFVRRSIETNHDRNKL